MESMYFPDIQDRISLTQKILIVLVFFSLPYVGLFYYFGYHEIALRLLIVEGFFCLCWYLSHSKFRNFSRIGIVLITNAAIFYFSQFIGWGAGIQILHFSMVLIPLALFLPEEKGLMAMAIILAITLFFMGSFFLFLNSQIIFTALQLKVISNSVALVSFLIALLSMNFVLTQLRVSNTDLHNSNTTLQTAYEDLQLQQKLLEKSWHDSVYAQLTRTIAHELKNPLFEFGMVIGALKTSLDDRETAMTFIDSLGQTIEELMELLHAMLESGGANVGEPKEMNISDVMRRVLILADGSFKKRNIRIHKEFENLPDIMGDPKSYLMVFSNLIVNAMEAMSEEAGPGGDLLVRLHRESSVADGMYGIRIEIEDSGSGIPKHRQDTLFRGGQSSKNIDERQRGIGLALVWKLIDQMGGNITVHSDPDTKPGTMFRIVV